MIHLWGKMKPDQPDTLSLCLSLCLSSGFISTRTRFVWFVTFLSQYLAQTYIHMELRIQTFASPVVFFSVFHRALFELLVHLPVEVVPQEEGPEPEQSVHLLRLADPQPFPLWNTSTRSPESTKAAFQAHIYLLDISVSVPLRHRRRYLWYPCWVKPLSLSSSWDGCQNLGRDWGVQP